MSVKIKDNVITLTRGDSLIVGVRIKFKNCKHYTPVEGDVVTFGLKKNIKDEECLFTKDIPIDTMILHLDPEDTAGLEYGDYVYDIQIKFANGDVNTFITYTKFKITGEVVR